MKASSAAPIRPNRQRERMARRAVIARPGRLGQRRAIVGSRKAKKPTATDATGLASGT
jgi:hypothetical protein